MNRFLEKDQMALSVFKQALPFKLIRNSMKTSSNIQSELDNPNWFSEEKVFPCSLLYTEISKIKPFLWPMKVSSQEAPAEETAAGSGHTGRDSAIPKMRKRFNWFQHS